MYDRLELVLDRFAEFFFVERTGEQDNAIINTRIPQSDRLRQ